MPQHIGIVACSAEGASLCYRTICIEGAQLLGPHAHPEVSLHCYPLADYMECVYRDDWPGVGELMSASAKKLASIGADFLICPDNTIHEALPFVLPRSPLPWLHIAEEVGKEAKRRGFRKLGITGTKFLVSGPVYPEKLEQMGIASLLPTKEQQEDINTIIFDELVRGLQTPESLFYFEQVIESLKTQGCDAVVLGCTELPLLVNENESPLPALDSTRTLARAALQHALAG